MSERSSERQRPRGRRDAPVCPVCGTPTGRDSATYPFCSPRCRLVDLGRWLGERYRVTRPLEQRDVEEGE